MLESGTKPPENRIHLFDPVGLINDGYGGTYRSSNYAVKPRRPTKSYGNFEEVAATNGGLKSYDSFNTDENGVGALRSYDSYTDPNNPGLRSYDSFSMETNNNGGNTTRSTSDHNNNNGDVNGLELRFGVQDNNGEMDEDYDVSTPRMWKPTSPPTSAKSLNSSSYFQNNNSFNNSTNVTNSANSSPFHPRNSKSLNSSPLHPSIVKNLNNNTNSSNSSVISVNSMPLNPSSPRHNYPQNMSPSSRTQAIAKGRKELMDMVRDLPESFYELSLKDIVDKKTEYGVQKGVGVGVGIGVDILEDKKGGKDNGIKSLETKTMKKKSKKVKKSESKKKMVVRGKNVDRGRFLLRTSVFPIFSRSKKNKKRLVNGNGNSFKVAPMSKPNPGSNGSMKVVEKDWWGRKSSIENDDGNGLSNKSESSESSDISSPSSSSNGRFRDRFLPTCCLFNGRRIRSKK